MASSFVYDTIKDYLVATFGATYPVYDWDQIEASVQHGSDPFLSLDDGSGGATLRSIGNPENNHTDDTGVVVIHTFTPTSGGASAARGIADQVRHAMQYHRFTAPAGESLRVIGVDPPDPGIINDGLWTSMMTVATYEHVYVVDTTAE